MISSEPMVTVSLVWDFILIAFPLLTAS